VTRLIILSAIYLLIVAGDVWITLWAVKHGKAKEWNRFLRLVIDEPCLFIEIELALFLVSVLVGYYYPLVLAFAILFRGLILAHNIIIIRSK
jgi:cytochrome c biogenesis factor